MKLNYAIRWFRKTAPALVISEAVITGLAAIPCVIEVRVRVLSDGLDITVATVDWFAVRRRVHWWLEDNHQNIPVGWNLDPNAEACGTYDRMDQVISSLEFGRPGRRSTPEP